MQEKLQMHINPILQQGRAQCREQMQAIVVHRNQAALCRSQMWEQIIQHRRRCRNQIQQGIAVMEWQKLLKVEHLQKVWDLKAAICRIRKAHMLENKCSRQSLYTMQPRQIQKPEAEVYQI